MRTKFESQLETLNNSIIEMGAFVEESIGDATEALLNMDIALAQKNVDFDKEIDQKMKEIESLCLKLLLSQQPVARDLRLISASLKMVSDLERIGDQCADISEIVLTMSKDAKIVQLDAIPPMSAATIKMVSQSVDAFVRRDLTLAHSVCDSDDEVDSLFVSAKKELVNAIERNSSNAESVIDFVMVAKYLERIGDHAVNVAKWVIFSITGNHGGVSLLSGAEEITDE